MLYKLKTDQPRQTNHKPIRVKVLLFVSVFNILSRMTLEEVTRRAILISWVKPLRKSEAGFTSTSHFKCSRSCLDATLILNPCRGPTYWNEIISSRESMTRLYIFNLCTIILDTPTTSFAL